MCLHCSLDYNKQFSRESLASVFHVVSWVKELKERLMSSSRSKSWWSSPPLCWEFSSLEPSCKNVCLSICCCGVGKLSQIPLVALQVKSADVTQKWFSTETSSSLPVFLGEQELLAEGLLQRVSWDTAMSHGCLCMLRVCGPVPISRALSKGSRPRSSFICYNSHVVLG